MTAAPELSPIPDLPPKIVRAALDGDLVLFVGAGVSRLLGLPSWDELAQSALRQLVAQKVMDYAELDQLLELDAKRKLSIAKLISREEGAPIDLTTCFEGKAEAGNIYELINSLGCVCVTTNYDELLAPRFTQKNGGSVAPRTTKRIYARSDLFALHLDSPGTVVHLHGSISDPKSMVVTTTEYLEHYDDTVVHEFLKSLFEKKTVLFVGYGLQEVEILEYVLRHGKAKDGRDIRRFLLQGFYTTQERLFQSLHSYYRDSFGVHVVGFSLDSNKYHQLTEIFRKWVPRISVRPPPLAADIDLMNEVLADE